MEKYLNEIAELGNIVDKKVNALRQKKIYVETNYDLHHKENHLEILKREQNIIQNIKDTCLKLNTEFYNFEEQLSNVAGISEQLEHHIKILSKHDTINLKEKSEKQNKSKFSNDENIDY